jgi:outer membrane protein TolC
MTFLPGVLLLLAAQSATVSSVPGDSLLAALVHEALANRPELAQARAASDADLAHAKLAGALPDPVVSLGLQNDGLQRLEVGRMETSWWSLGAAQTLPFPGKRSARARAQRLSARQSQADLERAKLSVRADVERAYVELLLVRDRLRILDRLEALWGHAEGLARTRYETGQGVQSDLLRAQLERGRLKQSRWALVAAEQGRVAALDRAAGRADGAPIATTAALPQLADPAPLDSAAAIADAEARSPELARARLERERTLVGASLARRELLPDVTLSGGVMPRGGAFETMWQAGVSMPLPLWSVARQSSVAGEARLRSDAAQGGEEAVRRLLRQRTLERRALLTARLESNRLYRSGLLVQSEANVSSVLAQYQVGRVPFANVLEALEGWLDDLQGYEESLAAAQRLDIAQRELSLESPDEMGGNAR